MGAHMHGLASLRHKLGLLTREDEKVVRREVKRTLVAIESGAKVRSPVRQGRLQNSITHETDRNGFGGRAGTNLSYGPDVEFGTAPHVIEPKNKKALAWGPKGSRTVRKRVHHPGTKAQPYLFPSFEEERPKHERRLVEALNAAHRKAAKR
ncbi:MAG: hypothetical protein AMXMBFR53_29960 [Gemmatimonadota bacterium]